MLLQNKIAVVTGCNKGIGKKIVQTFSENGAKVLVLEKSIWRNNLKGKELGLFFRSGFAPRDRNRYELAVDGGFNFFNPLTKMEGDVVGVGVAFAKVSDSIEYNFEAINDDNSAV